MGKIYNEKINKANNPSEDTSILAVGTFIEPVTRNIKFRDDEINKISTIMGRSNFRSVIIVGDSGIGKRSILEGYANMLANEKQNIRIINLDFNMMLDGINQPSEYKQVVNGIFDKVINGDENEYILNINNIGHILHQQCYANGGYSFLNQLPNEIENNAMRIIATTTTKEFKDLEDNFSYMLDYFTVIKLTELTKEQTLDIVNEELDDFMNYHHILLPKNSGDTICFNADKYIKDKPFPLKAEILLDDVCSYIRRNKLNNDDINEMYDEINKLKLDIVDYIKNNDYEKSKEVNNRINELEAKVQKLSIKKVQYKATEDDVLEAIGSIVNVNMSKLSKDKTQFLKEMPIELKKSVIGQDETIDKIVKNIRRNQLGFRKSAHSAGNFIFIGSTGVGKTHLAKQLAKYLYGSEENILRFDMSEFQSEIDVSKLLGSAPGYVGYKESGLLVKGLAKKPESVVLFDEIEKAHPKIYDVLLQLLDEGYITGSDGKKVDGSKALIIFTSNVGVRAAKELSSPLGFTKNSADEQAKKEEAIMRKEFNKRFSPEFINRIDSICYFNPLGHDTLLTILNNELKEMNINIRQITGKEVVLTPAVNEWLIEQVEKEKNGARPIIRLLQQEIEEQVADLVIEDDERLKTRKKTITADIVDNKIILQ